MADQKQEFETRDNEGTTSHFNGNVGTTAIAIPTTAGELISELIISAGDLDNSLLYVSFDGGTNFFSLESFASLAWTPKGNLTQIHIKGSTANVAYQIIMNRGPA